MELTPPTLLERLARPGDAAAWTRFIDLYQPLLCAWARRMAVPAQDIPDLVQNALIKILTNVGRFRRKESGSFRAWMYTILEHAWRDLGRARQRQPVAASRERLEAEPETDPLLQWTETEYHQYLLRRIALLIRADFPDSTWRAFELYVLEDRPALEVARDLGITANSVYLARGRVLRRIREELAGLLD